MIKLLKAARIKKGYKQEEIAAMISVSKSTYSLMERGLRPVSAKKAKILSEKLCEPIGKLFSRKETNFFV